MRGIVPVASTLPITNCMRETTGNDNFFRSSDTNNDDKFRLNLTGDVDSFCQTLIGYSNDATLDYDNGLDAIKITSTTASITTLIGATKYAIQTRPAFQESDIVLSLIHISEPTRPY